MRSCSQDDAGRGVSLRCHPGAVECVGDEQEGQDKDKGNGCFTGNCRLLLEFLGLLGILRFGLGIVHAPDVLGQKMGHCNAREDAHDRSQNEHQTNHYALEGETIKWNLQGIIQGGIFLLIYREINAGDSVEDDEDIGVGEFGEAEIETGWEEED